MPTYKLPPLKRAKKSDSNTVPVAEDSWRRRVTMPVNAAILDCCEVGDDMTFTITGKIVAMSMNRSDSRESHDITLELSSIKCPD